MSAAKEPVKKPVVVMDMKKVITQLEKVNKSSNPVNALKPTKPVATTTTTTSSSSSSSSSSSVAVVPGKKPPSGGEQSTAEPNNNNVRKFGPNALGRGVAVVGGGSAAQNKTPVSPPAIVSSKPVETNPFKVGLKPVGPVGTRTLDGGKVEPSGPGRSPCSSSSSSASSPNESSAGGVSLSAVDGARSVGSGTVTKTLHAMSQSVGGDKAGSNSKNPAPGTLGGPGVNPTLKTPGAPPLQPSKPTPSLEGRETGSKPAVGLKYPPPPIDSTAVKTAEKGASSFSSPVPKPAGGKPTFSASTLPRVAASGGINKAVTRSFGDQVVPKAFRGTSPAKEGTTTRGEEGEEKEEEDEEKSPGKIVSSSSAGPGKMNFKSGGGRGVVAPKVSTSSASYPKAIAERSGIASGPPPQENSVDGGPVDIANKLKSLLRDREKTLQNATMDKQEINQNNNSATRTNVINKQPTQKKGVQNLQNSRPKYRLLPPPRPAGNPPRKLVKPPFVDLVRFQGLSTRSGAVSAATPKDAENKAPAVPSSRKGTPAAVSVTSEDDDEEEDAIYEECDDLVAATGRTSTASRISELTEEEEAHLERKNRGAKKEKEEEEVKQKLLPSNMAASAAEDGFEYVEEAYEDDDEIYQEID